MPISPVFGTEHELMCVAACPTDSVLDRWSEEYRCAFALLRYFVKYFFPARGNDDFLAKMLPRDPCESARPDGRAANGDSLRGEVLVAEERERERMPDYLYYCGFMTPLGSRMYLDHGYFEISSPECDDPFVALASDIAHDALIKECVDACFAGMEHPPRFYKNISDGVGHSQAAHRNFCMTRSGWSSLVSHGALRDARDLTWRDLTRETKLCAMWHAVEPLLIGAGKYGDESGDRTFIPDSSREYPFQISGRADFIERIASNDTVVSRPLVNQRNEPLADREKYGRYHCISGDANRAEWPYLFKMGLTAIVLGMIEDDFLDFDYYIENPVAAMRAVSRDRTGAVPLELISFRRGGRAEVLARAVLQHFLHAMERYVASRSAPWWCGKILEKALWATHALAHQPELLDGVLDWKIKEGFVELEARGQKKAFLRHMEYHALSGPTMIYPLLYKEGVVETVIPRDMIEKYKHSPPETTRAYFRGKCIDRFSRDIDFFATDWKAIVLRDPWNNNSRLVIQMPEPLALTRAECGDIFEGVENVSRDRILRYAVGGARWEEEYG